MIQKPRRKTKSVCPVCFKKIPASIILRGEDYFMEKTCAEHGFFKTVVWRGANPSYDQWREGYKPEIRVKGADEPDCINDCGLCSHHLQKTCCALVEVTSRCNLSCPVCFAESGEGSEPDVNALAEEFKTLVKNGNTFVQLSGGEPTVRDDLPRIIAAARLAGCENIQLNTNGLRLANEKGYAKALADAGLSFVFMQFDGTEDGVYEKLRGRSLFADKCRAIDNCADAFLGVTLVPTIVPNVNTHNIGAILDFAVNRSPAVRGVHFQPVSYFGRYPEIPKNGDRITLPEILRAIETQSEGKLKLKDFRPSSCDHPYCGFHGDFAVLPDKSFIKLTPKNQAICCDGEEHIKNRRFVSRRWRRDKNTGDTDGVKDFSGMTEFLSRVKSHGLTITAMAFQDAMNLDLRRLRRCSLHVAKDGKLKPFCANYITSF